MIPEYLFYDGAQEDENTWVDITEFVEKRVNAGAKIRPASLDQAGVAISRTSPKPN